MKKIITIILSITLLFSLSACRSKNETAEEAMNSALTAVKNLDVITANKYFDFKDIIDRDLPVDLDVDIKDLNKEHLEIAKLLVKNFDFEVLESKEEKDKATVKVDLTNVDMLDLLSQYIQYSIGLAFTEKDQEVIDEKLQVKMLEILDAEDIKLASQEVNISLNKIDGKWKINLDKSAVNAILGGLINIANSFE